MVKVYTDNYVADADAAKLMQVLFTIYHGVCVITDTLPSYLSYFYLNDLSGIYNLDGVRANASNDPLIALSKF